MISKIRKSFAICAMAVVLTLAFIIAQAAEPGSSGDPLVSKSYVDAKIAEVLSLLGVNAAPQGQTAQTQEELHAFEPVSASVGQIVIGGEGAEIILRSGKGVGYLTGQDGLVNVTTGTELFNGYEVAKNNLIIVPRSDGRGIKVIEDAWFIIKGDYYILN